MTVHQDNIDLDRKADADGTDNASLLDAASSTISMMASGIPSSSKYNQFRRCSV